MGSHKAVFLLFGKELYLVLFEFDLFLLFWLLNDLPVVSSVCLFGIAVLLFFRVVD